MRELRFRAWDKDCCRFEYFEIGENDDCYGIFRVTANKFGSVIEQYTGLKDKNGKEIYENCELDGRYVVEYIAPSFVGRDIINGDTIELYGNKFTITKEHSEIPQNSERSIN